MKRSMLILNFFLATFLMNAQDKRMLPIESLLEKALNKEQVKNVYLSLSSPVHQLNWHYVNGHFSEGTPVSLDHPFYTASVGKTFTATAIGMLVDQAKLSFDDPIAAYLPETLMNGLHVLEGEDHGNHILVSHLLQHTSGLPDYFGTQTKDNTPTMFDLIMMDTARMWQPEALIQFSKDHLEPAFEPGANYHYTDTEYVLLGMIVEQITQMKLHDFFSQYIFDPLGMKHTYLNQRSEPEAALSRMAEMYAGDAEISTFTSLSADWAGGAVVATGRDLNKFLQALLSGKLVSESTLTAMQQWIDESQGMSYGYGLRRIKFKELSPSLPDWEVIGHSGLNGTSMYYCPELDVYLSGTLNQLEASREAVMLMIEVLMAYGRIRE